VAVRSCDRALSHGISGTGTALMLASMYVDDILLAVSAQVGHLLQAGNLRPAPLALHDLGGVPGQYDLRWPPQFVDLRALTSMLNSATVGYSFLGATLDTVTHPCGCPRLRPSVVTQHQWHWDCIDARARAREEAQDGLHRQSWRIKDETLTIKG